MEEDVNRKTNFERLVEFHLVSQDQENSFSFPVFTFSISIMACVKSEFVLKKIYKVHGAR